MAHCCCEWPDTYISEKILYPAHCDTCACPRNEIKVSRKVSTPKYRVSCSACLCHCQTPENVCCCCHYEQETNKKFCLCYECRKIRGRSEASIHNRGTHLNYSLLETWFDRFDTDGDGYIDLHDLESLLKHLGTKKHRSYSKNVLKKCDKDSDGRLSFPEFVQLWNITASHDEDFVKKVDCSELSDIVRKYKIFPHTFRCKCLDYHCKHTTFAREKPARHTQCKCGQKDKIIPFIKHYDNAHHPPRKKSKLQNSKVTEDPDKLPTMSMNRDNIF